MHRFFNSLPLRYSALALCALVLCISSYTLATSGKGLWWLIASTLLVLLGLWDMVQKRHAILRNYPVMGHFRFIFEFIRPEIRQYFIEGDTEALPFSRAERSLVYQRAKGQVDNRPFGTLIDVGAQGYEWVNHSMQPTKLSSHDFRIWIGGSPEQAAEGADPCTLPYHASVFNISAMSFGALSGNAIQALNQGAKIGGFIHDTGEGSLIQRLNGIARQGAKTHGRDVEDTGVIGLGARLRPFRSLVWRAANPDAKVVRAELGGLHGMVDPFVALLSYVQLSAEGAVIDLTFRTLIDQRPLGT